jgi:hypothetical protein
VSGTFRLADRPAYDQRVVLYRWRCFPNPMASPNRVPNYSPPRSSRCRLVLPRWLVKVGREDEARYILGRLRGETGADAQKADTELSEIQAVSRMEKVEALPTSYLSMLTGRGSGDLHIGRRVQLVVWLQIFQEWVGIAGVTICKLPDLHHDRKAYATCRRSHDFPTFWFQL